MKLRPFVSANDFRTRTRKQKGVGNNMLETYLDVITGMSEVDKVLTDCEQIGAQLDQVMSIWKSGAALSADTPTAKPGASGSDEVGLDLVAISEDTLAARVDTSTDPRVREAFKDFIRHQPAGVPDTVKLKDYQMLGVNWLNLLYRRGTSCILADEMGLGKTAQVIALLAHLKATGEPGPHLVIVPSSVLDNWMREFSVFAPDLVVVSYYGSQGERHEIRNELRSMEGNLDVVVTTYNIATGSPDDQKFLKRKMDFKVTVFDEGHQLKNSESKKYKDLMQVRAQWRLLLTGTPLQNNLQELVVSLPLISFPAA
jgi:SWI/SNF-related matrix-associated actin-dependent regulator 1 of chromatin subfamily A